MCYFVILQIYKYEKLIVYEIELIFIIFIQDEKEKRNIYKKLV